MKGEVSQMKRRISKLYTIIAVLVCILATSSFAFGGFSPYTFSGIITHPTGTYRTVSKIKTDNSPGYAHYVSGASNFVRVEMWASDGTSGDYQNFTCPHIEDGVSNAKYYNLDTNEVTYICNTVYEYYNHPAYCTMLFTGFNTGNISGYWATMTD